VPPPPKLSEKLHGSQVEAGRQRVIIRAVLHACMALAWEEQGNGRGEAVLP
jgi:hypothetical protein